MDATTIENLPDPVIEYILSYLSPYRDLKQCMLVNKDWYKHVHEVIRKTRRDLNIAIASMSVRWHHLSLEPGPTVSKRYSHSACCCGDSMYVFGGCTTANTTFNDLWRLDLSTRCWIRPLATGTYPPPKACASLVCYEENLVLFGGWTHTSPYPLHQVWRIFNHLHIYNTNTNRWTQVSTPTSSPAMAGHSATIHGDSMVVFGGIQKHSRDGPHPRHSIFSSCNSVWVLDMKTLNWKRQKTTSTMPLPRYGHSQIAIDDHHLLIMGGCGGPNMLLSDIWLLKMKDNASNLWEWQEIEVRMKENAAPHLAFHPACKVGNQVVVMSKTQRSQMSPSSLPHLLRVPSRVWVPPIVHHDESMDSRHATQQSVDVEPCVNGKKGVLKRQFERHQPNSSSRTSSSDEDDFHSQDFAKKMASCSSPKRTSPPRIDALLNQAGPSHVTTHNSSNPSILSVPQTSSYSAAQTKDLNCDRNSVSPASDCDSHVAYMPYKEGNVADMPYKEGNEQQSQRPAFNFRPNSRRNRQRQLEGLDRMEQRLRDLRAGALTENVCVRSNFTLTPLVPKQKVSALPVASKNPMCLYVLDISRAVSDGYVAWRKLQNQSNCAPEGIILYSLVLGRGELIMFGGIQKDLNSKFQEGETVPEVVSNSLHFMSAHRFVI